MATGTSVCGHPSRLAEDGEHLRMTVVVGICEFFLIDARVKPAHDVS
jgi:hypothetical protein